MKDREKQITARPDGELKTVPLSSLPMGAARLEARLEKQGRRLRIGVWGGGDVGRLHLDPMPVTWSVRPNFVRSDSFSVAMAQSRPALAVRGSSFRFRPSSRPIAGIDVGARTGSSRRTAEGIEVHELAWGCTAIRRSGEEGVVVGAGANPEEALAGARMELGDVMSEAERYAQECAKLETADATLGSMFAHSLHAAFAAVKQGADGSFAGLAAGPGYSLPPRTYYRDAYWTVPALLPTRPQSVRDTLELLAAGIHDDGEAPSAVITPTQLPASVRDAIREHKGTGVVGGDYESDWWRDHFDSPLMFIAMLQEYVAFTGDDSPVDGCWTKILAILDRYAGFCPPGSDLPRKPYNERDWADNVFRSGLVTYDLGLYYGALDAVAKLSASRDPRLSARVEATAGRVRDQLNETMWSEESGHYLDYRSDDAAEDHLAIDTLTVLRFHLADDERTERMLESVRLRLETRNNRDQPYGDFGVMCCFPPYSRRADLKAKSAFPFRYHNGADWPYWDGVYAGLLLERGREGWRYPLLRWWEHSLEQGWASPVEYFSPPYAPGAPLQAWSAMPAAAVMQDGFGVKPPFDLGVPPWGESSLRDVFVQGRITTLVSDGERVRRQQPREVVDAK